MPTQSVSVPYDQFRAKANRHDQMVSALSGVDPRLQKMVAELLMMRLFDEFQDAISGVALRLACGTPYADGTPPSLLAAPARSLDGARTLYSTHGRKKPSQLRWSKASFINDSTEFVLSPGEPFLTACSANSVLISEMQAVRNRIAHNNKNARAAYGVVIKRHYGAVLNHMTPGLFLLSPQATPARLETYIQICRVIVKSASRS